MEALAQLPFQGLGLEHGASGVVLGGRRCASSHSSKYLVNGFPVRFSRREASVFTDESHLSFYTNIFCGKKEKAERGLRRGAQQALTREEAATQEFLQKLDEINSFLGVQDVIKRKAAKDRGVRSRPVDSSSSSSSESECEVPKMRIRRGREPIRRTWENIQKELEIVSSSSIFRSIPSYAIIPNVPGTIDVLGHTEVLQRHEEDQNRPKILLTDISSTLSSSVSSSSSANASSSHVDGKQRTDQTGFFKPNAISVSSIGTSVARGFANVDDAIPIERGCSRVEVCMGGKCKKNGAQDVLSAFQSSMPGGNVSAFTKCMKNCRAAVNVRIQKDTTTNPQIHSSVGVEDVDTLLRQHLGVGAPPSGLPSLGSFPFPLGSRYVSESFGR